MIQIFRLIQACALLLFIPVVSSAQEVELDDGGGGRREGGGGEPMITNPLGDQSLLSLINVVIDGVITLLVPIIILMVIYSGFLFVTAQGNTDKLSKAKMTLGYTLLGALLILGAHALSELIENTVSSLNT